MKGEQKYDISFKDDIMCFKNLFTVCKSRNIKESCMCRKRKNKPLT